MIRVDEEALICDFAETYGIYNYRELPLLLCATYAVGLRENSRIKMKMTESEMGLTDTLLAGIFDRLSLLVYAQTADAQKGINYPKLIMTSIVDEKDKPSQGFATGEDYEKERKRILQSIKKGGK